MRTLEVRSVAVVDRLYVGPSMGLVRRHDRRIYADQANVFFRCVHPTEGSYYGNVTWSWWPPATLGMWGEGLEDGPHYYFTVAFCACVLPPLVIAGINLRF